MPSRWTHRRAVLDDKASIRQFARRVLELRGHRVIEAGDGGTALVALEGLPSLELVDTDLAAIVRRILAERA